MYEEGWNAAQDLRSPTLQKEEKLDLGHQIPDILADVSHAQCHIRCHAQLLHYMYLAPGPVQCHGENIDRAEHHQGKQLY